MFDEFYTLLKKAASGLPPELLTESVAKKLYIHITELEEKSKSFNLTAITDPSEAVNKHSADCLFAAAEIMKLSAGRNCTLIDVGSGGGFPALPIAAALPNASVTALDATAKKCAFIKETAEKCNVPLRVLTGRAEELSAGDARESFDFACARAVAVLSVLAELCLPLVKVGGYLVAMKGSAAETEAKEAQRAVKKLGARLEEILSYEVEGGGKRFLLVYKKEAPTPEGFPRAYARIRKKPL